MVLINQEMAMTEDGIYPFEMGYLPEQFQKKAEIEVKDSQENRERGIRLMREMTKKDKHFDGLNFHDDCFLQYLRCRKFDVPRAFSQLKALLNLRRKHPSCFTDFKFEKLAISTRKKILTFLPWRCSDGCAILLIQLDKWDPEEISVEEAKRIVAIFILQALRDLMTQINGIKVIFDVKSSLLTHLRHATPSNIHLIYHGVLECAPGRFKEFHIVNDSLTFKAGYFLLRPFLSAKLKQRFHFHSKPDDLLNFFPAGVLPVEYGGDLIDYDMTGWMKKMLEPEMLATLVGEVSTEKKY